MKTMNGIMENDNSYKTAIARTKMSAPFKNFLKSYGDTIKNKTILDFGCGKGKDVEEATNLGYTITGYDPNNKKYPMPNSNLKFNVIYCGYVLNVIHPMIREIAINSCWERVADNGMAVFVARTDTEINKLAEKGKWNKENDGFRTSKGTFQKGFNRSELSKLIQDSLPVGEYAIMTTTDFDCSCSAVVVRRING